MGHRPVIRTTRRQHSEEGRTSRQHSILPSPPWPESESCQTLSHTHRRRHSFQERGTPMRVCHRANHLWAGKFSADLPIFLMTPLPRTAHPCRCCRSRLQRTNRHPRTTETHRRSRMASHRWGPPVDGSERILVPRSRRRYRRRSTGQQGGQPGQFATRPTGAHAKPMSLSGTSAGHRRSTLIGQVNPHRKAGGSLGQLSMTATQSTWSVLVSLWLPGVLRTDC